jgi:hypothetical protein
MVKKDKEIQDIELQGILGSQIRNSLGYLGGELIFAKKKIY